MAAKVRTEATQAGALGDPYGSGVRTVWWVFGVGPVKMIFEHAGGSDAPITTSELQATNQTPKPAPADANYFPLTKGLKLKYRWTNTKWIKKPSIQVATIDEVVNNSARFTFQHVSGPDQGRGQLRLLDADRRGHQHLGADEGRNRDQVPDSWPEVAAGRQAPPLLHAVRPDELRLQSAADRVPRARAGLGLEESQP